MTHTVITEMLKEQLFPALGCTEPAAIAYAGALAGSRVRGDYQAVKLTLDKNLFKNSLRVTIGGTKFKGPHYALALGLVGGNPAHRLEALKDLGEEHYGEADRLVASGVITMELRQACGLFIEVDLKTAEDRVRCRIEGQHEGVTLLEVNEQAVTLPRVDSKVAPPDFKGLNLAEILAYVRSVPVDDLLFIEEGRQMNQAVAQAALAEGGDNFFGPALREDSPLESGRSHMAALLARSHAAAACDARMGGTNRSVMALAGSGNQGITSIVPVAVYCDALGIGQGETLRALALSQLLTCYIKAKIGLLAAVCGCAIAAGAGMGAAVVFLAGGSDDQIKAAINSIIGGLAGMICDGAKGGCAFKISVATSAAFDAANLALQGVFVQPGDGIVAGDAEETINNVVRVADRGMDKVDDTIVEIMQKWDAAREP